MFESEYSKGSPQTSKAPRLADAHYFESHCNYFSNKALCTFEILSTFLFPVFHLKFIGEDL